MDITELQQVQHDDDDDDEVQTRSAKASRDLSNLLVISGLRTGPKLITASAPDSTLSSPKVKIKTV